MILPSFLSPRDARYWLLEAFGEPIHGHDHDTCVAPHVFRYDPHGEDSMVQLFALAKNIGECEDEILWSESPFARFLKEENETFPS